ncbi:N-acetyltransferase [Chitinophaga silvatica]|uniref:N-acetyltransferase n=1 Tax=Chitinophaga silvatica TaxID=2282649 RepID=A0A3E1Y8Z2_9BACT|nr:N-acetyltransferase [Chitinophaga silvatica]RFS21875.1 N-acetyltransferase [Chitinophaga silvatica]
MNIITKFTVVTKQGMETLLMLTKDLAIEKFSSLIKQNVLENYILKNFNEQALVAEVNSISNQWLVVYVDDQPAGYACITSKGKRPENLEGKRAARILYFGVLNKYPAPAVKDALLEKCLSVCKSYENIWIDEYIDNPVLELFEHKGFIRQPGTGKLDGLPLTSVCLIM